MQANISGKCYAATPYHTSLGVACKLYPAHDLGRGTSVASCWLARGLTLTVLEGVDVVRRQSLAEYSNTAAEFRE